MCLCSSQEILHVYIRHRRRFRFLKQRRCKLALECVKNCSKETQRIDLIKPALYLTILTLSLIQSYLLIWLLRIICLLAVVHYPKVDRLCSTHNLWFASKKYSPSIIGYVKGISFKSPAELRVINCESLQVSLGRQDWYFRLLFASGLFRCSLPN